MGSELKLTKILDSLFTVTYVGILEILKVETIET